MATFSLEGWANFFAASAGAAAALAGLLFVSLSINLSRILSIPGLASRAGETFIPLGSVMIISLAALMPRQSDRIYGVWPIVLGLVSWAAVSAIEAGAFRAGHFIKHRHLVIRVGIGQSATLLMALGGLTIRLGSPSGFTWLATGVLVAFAGTMFNAWILLVEILR